ncbi:MAG: hypothetical protein WCE69_03825, partial [Aestuariivirga sp.]
MIQRSVPAGARIGLAGAERPAGELQIFNAASSAWRLRLMRLERCPGMRRFPLDFTRQVTLG